MDDDRSAGDGQSGGEKVVSLAQHRARRSPRDGQPRHETAHPDAPAAAPPEAASRDPLPGKLVWLHCPACDTLEYTELELPGGRRHKCGTVVEEIPVEIDVRAESTVAAINLQRIDTIVQYLGQQRERFTEYQERLRLIAGRPVAPYPVEEGMLSELPVAEIDALGLLISPALHEPARRFGPEAPAPEAAASEQQTGDAPAADPPQSGDGPGKDGEG